MPAIAEPMPDGVEKAAAVRLTAAPGEPERTPLGPASTPAGRLGGPVDDVLTGRVTTDGGRTEGVDTVVPGTVTEGAVTPGAATEGVLSDGVLTEGAERSGAAWPARGADASVSTERTPSPNPVRHLRPIQAINYPARRNLRKFFTTLCGLALPIPGKTAPR